MTTTPKNSYKTLRHTLIVVSLCAALSLAFGDKPEDTYETVVHKNEFDCITSDFDSYFRAGPSVDSLVPISGKKIRIKITAFDSILAEVKQQDKEPYALKIYHGLEHAGATYNYAPVIAFGSLSEDQDADWFFSPLDSGYIHRITRDAALARMDQAAWEGWSDYLDHVHVQPNSSMNKMRKALQGEDVETYTFRLSEVEDLIDQNRIDATYLTLNCVAEPLFHDGEDMRFMRHHICLLTADRNGDNLLDTLQTPSNAPYSHRGADTGSPCPPRCARTYLPKHGTPVRKNCLP